jgi:hypothetical protein
MRRALRLSVSVVATVAALAPAGVTLATRQVTTATVYRAYRANGTSTLRTHARTGSCFSGSATAARGDAWRCMTGNEIEDPCFSTSTSASSVVCPAAPWRDTGVEIRLARPLPRRYADHGAPSLRSQPWALELYDGRRCLLASGASTTVEGRRLNYFCGISSHIGLWGLPNRSPSPWTILTAPFTAKQLTQRATIRHAWM